MRELVIGADGMIGRAVHAAIPGAIGTTKRTHGRHYLDLLDFTEEDVPACDVAYLCAGANGAKACEGDQWSFRVNVDAPIELARIIGARGGFLVWISSMSVEWLSTAYQRQKLAAECVLRARPDVGIVRAGRVLNGNLDDLVDTLLQVGRNRIPGVTRWGNDDIAYAKG